MKRVFTPVESTVCTSSTHHPAQIARKARMISWMHQVASRYVLKHVDKCPRDPKIVIGRRVEGDSSDCGLRGDSSPRRRKAMSSCHFRMTSLVFSDSSATRKTATSFISSDITHRSADNVERGRVDMHQPATEGTPGSITFFLCNDPCVIGKRKRENDTVQGSQEQPAHPNREGPFRLTQSSTSALISTSSHSCRASTKRSGVWKVRYG